MSRNSSKSMIKNEHTQSGSNMTNVNYTGSSSNLKNANIGRPPRKKNLN